MNQAIVERAIAALAKIGAARDPKKSADKPTKPEDTQSNPSQEKVAPCGPLLCGGCYDVEEGKKIHPPKCGEDYRAWLERWEGKGRVQ